MILLTFNRIRQTKRIFAVGILAICIALCLFQSGMGKPIRQARDLTAPTRRCLQTAIKYNSRPHPNRPAKRRFTSTGTPTWVWDSSGS